MTLPPDLVDRVRVGLAEAGERPTPAHVAAALRSYGVVLGDAAVLEVVASLRAELIGAGPLQTLLSHPGVTDVLVNGPHQVWVDRGAGLERAAVRFADAAAVRAVAARLAAVGGRRLDDAAPCVDARLPDGTRLHAVLAPVAPDGPLISLRVPPRMAFSLAELVGCGTVPGLWEPWVRGILAARLAFLVVGGTGTGKTTLLSCLLGLVDPAERIVVIEDSAELRPDHPHVVRLECRAANVEGSGAVGLADLVRQSLRMRPDRVVVGEVRGAEVVELLTALNTGHEGGCGTLHANTGADVPARLEALGTAAGLPRDAVHSLVGSALHVVVVLRRTPAGRRMVGVDVLVRAHDGLVSACPALSRTVDDQLVDGPGLPVLRGLLAAHGWVEPC